MDAPHIQLPVAHTIALNRNSHITLLFLLHDNGKRRSGMPVEFDGYRPSCSTSEAMRRTPQRVCITPVEILWDSDAVVFKKDGESVILFADRNGDLPFSSIRECMFYRVGNQFVYDQSERDSSVNGDGNISDIPRERNALTFQVEGLQQIVPRETGYNCQG